MKVFITKQIAVDIERKKIFTFVLDCFLKDYPNMLIRTMMLTNGEFNEYWKEKEREYYIRKERSK